MNKTAINFNLSLIDKNGFCLIPSKSLHYYKKYNLNYREVNIFCNNKNFKAYKLTNK